MRITWDKQIDIAYIHLEERDEYQDVESTHHCDPRLGSMINLDFDAEGRLIGIELSSASKVLPQPLLDKAILY